VRWQASRDLDFHCFDPSKADTAAIEVALPDDEALHRLPRDREIRRWTEKTIPADWATTRDRWAANHTLRLLLGAFAYGCLLTAVFLIVSARRSKVSRWTV
jgi:hypothetical protein